MTSRFSLRSFGAIALALVLAGGLWHTESRDAWATPFAPTGSGAGGTESVVLSGQVALRAVAVSQISVSAPDTVRASEGDSIYILATAASGSPYSIISIEINGVPPNCTFSTNTPTPISPSATLSGFLGYQTSGIWHLLWIASDQYGARDTASTKLIVKGSPVDVHPARVFTTSNGEVIRLSNGKHPWCVQVEPFAGYPISDVILSSLELVYGGRRIRCDAEKTVIDGDSDGNGMTEIRACFAQDDLKVLFAELPPGRSLVQVEVHGAFVNASEFSGRLWVEVVAKTSRLAASLSPNPLNPDATLTFSTTNTGPIAVSMFDLQGRFVRDLWTDPFAQAGDHRVRIDGRGRHGERLASGVYVYRITTREGVTSGRIVVLK